MPYLHSVLLELPRGLYVKFDAASPLPDMLTIEFHYRRGVEVPATRVFPLQ